MLNRDLKQILGPHSLTAYLLGLENGGRASVDSDERLRMATVYTDLQRFRRANPVLSARDEAVLGFATDFLESEDYLAFNDKARYPAYTNVKVLNRYIGVGQRLHPAEIWRRCRYAIHVLATDWLDFESRALRNFQHGEDVGKGFDSHKIDERITALKIFSETVSSDAAPKLPSLDRIMAPDDQIDWEVYALAHEGAFALARTTALPQSQYHDEYLFLRTIHIAETCFWAIIIGIQATTQFAAAGRFSDALFALREANSFAMTLVRVFQVFKTLPIENFVSGFRDSTGNSSAIMSEKYQHLEFLSRGVSDEKRQILVGLEEHAWMQTWNPPVSATLRGLIEGLIPLDEEYGTAILAEAKSLDRNLLRWRGVHLGIAQDYLPVQPGTGGTDGVPYLRGNYMVPAIGSDDAKSESDGGVLRVSLFADLRIHPAFEIGAISAKGLSAEAFIEAIDSVKEDLLTEIRVLGDDRDTFDPYASAFGRFSYDFPLRGQLRHVIKKGLPDDPVAAFLLGMECKHGLLMGLHDAATIKGPILFETAVSGQDYDHLRGGPRRTKPGEWVFQDSRKVFASYFQGPDRKTAVQLSRQSGASRPLDIYLLVMGAPGIAPARMDAAIAHAQNFLEPLCASIAAIRAWVGT